MVRDPEPNPKKRRRSGGESRARTARESRLRFVVQKHAARRLHYDFRLELDGVLKSWAVTKGPSLVPSQKRLAVRVEDHPLAYGSFEGTIPEGEYGAGAVQIWDEGIWRPIGDPHDGLSRGSLEFDLAGEKLKGRWRLTRMRNRDDERQEKWLLIKSADAMARAPKDPDILADQPRSVESGRSIEQIAAATKSRQLRTDGRDGGARQEVLEDPRDSKDRRGEARAHPGAARPSLSLTHPDKLLWPEAGVSKRDLADYYAYVWRWMRPFIVNRPLALLRCPSGVAGDCFFQKHPFEGMGAHIAEIADPRGGRPLLTIKDFDGLMDLTQAATLEIHPWGARADDLERPDWLIIDLDPGEGATWSALVAAATDARRRLTDRGLASFVKTTGGAGLHVVAPIQPDADWQAVGRLSKSLADDMARAAPDRYAKTIAKKERAGKIFVDYLRNGRGATAIAPYSTRARPGCGVATPLDWAELESIPDARHFTLAQLPQRLARQTRDPWRQFFTIRQRIPLL